MDLLSPCLPRDHPLAGCEQKLWRANKHFELLSQEIEALRDGEFHPATFRTERKPDAKDTYWTVVESVSDPPFRLATIVGDIVHNLRSSLDYLVFELAFLGLGGKRTPKGTGFPVSRTRSNWNDSHVQGLLADVMQKHRAMLYRAQPCYRRKDNPTASTLRRRPRQGLAVLHDLWNEDKHRMIQLAVLAPYGIKPEIRLTDCEPRSEPTSHTAPLARPLEVGAKLYTIPIRPTGPEPKVYVKVEVTFHVCLLDGTPVLKFFSDVGNGITQIIQGFEPVFETPRARRLWGVPRERWPERQPRHIPRVRPGRWSLADGQPLTPAE